MFADDEMSQSFDMFWRYSNYQIRVEVDNDVKIQVTYKFAADFQFGDEISCTLKIRWFQIFRGERNFCKLFTPLLHMWTSEQEPSRR